MLSSSGSVVPVFGGQVLSPRSITLLVTAFTYTYLRPLSQVLWRVTTLSFTFTMAYWSLLPVIPKTLAAASAFFSKRQIPELPILSVILNGFLVGEPRLLRQRLILLDPPVLSINNLPTLAASQEVMVSSIASFVQVRPAPISLQVQTVEASTTQ